MTTRFRHHLEPAISPYAPGTRNTFLHFHSNQSSSVGNGSRNNQISTKKKLATLLGLLYIINKFWDVPMLRKVYSRIFSSLSSPSSSVSPSFFVRCFARTAEILRLSQMIPASLKQRILAERRNDNSNVNEEINIDTERKIIAMRNIDVGINTTCVTTISTKNTNNITNDYEVQQLKWHGEQIDSVLQYWFGQYSPDKAQKNLWMISSSSKEQLLKVDTEIMELYSPLLYHISTDVHMRNLWCGEQDDDTGRDNNNSHSFYGWKGKLAAIILLDQMSRHIHRYEKTQKLHDSSDKTPSKISNEIPQQHLLDNLAFQISKIFQQQHNQEIITGMIPTPMLIFSLMPYRHASTLQTVGFVQHKVEEIATMTSIDMENMIRRFRRATNRRMAVLQDEARKAGKNTHYDDQEEDQKTKKDNKDDYDRDQKHESKQKEFRDDDILEFQPFIADMSKANKHSIVKVVIDFLTARGIHRVKKKNTTKSIIIRDTPVLVSLSGGVDSMVIASVLAFLRDNCDYDQLYLGAVHIDYGNRPESAAEARFVKKYALDVVKFDLCIVRRIDEVTRGETRRDEYEKVSRNVRYDLYKSTISKCIQICTKRNLNCDIKEVGVMLGHHRGDLVENVISNSNKGCGPLDLSGMTDVSKNDGVTIYRPLLPLDKEEVYDYSHKFGVPYFKDTTPHWSTRGKLRNKLIPLLEEVYGDGCLNNLAKLAEESDEARDLFNKSAFRPFMDTVVHYPMGVVFRTAPFKSQGSYFWKIVLRDLLHSIGLGMFSDKSIESFLIRALSDKIKEGWLQCRKDYAVYLMHDGRVMVLYPKFFPWRKQEFFNIDDEAVPVGSQKIIGPWSIETQKVSSLEAGDLLKKKAMKSIEALMTGQISYYVNVPITKSGEIKPLVLIDKFTKETRPYSWKNCDVKVETTLPLLGIDPKISEVQFESSDLNNMQLVKVSLKLNKIDS